MDESKNCLTLLSIKSMANRHTEKETHRYTDTHTLG